MATNNYVVSLSIDDKGAVAAVNDMTKALDKADSSSQSLKAQLRQMQQELQKLDVGSAEFQKLAREAGELKDRINDASEAVRANAGGAFERLSGNASVLRQRLFDLDFEGAGQSVKALASSAKSLTFKEATQGLKGFTSGIVDLGKAILTNPILLLGSVIVGIVSNFEALTKAGGAVGSFFSGISNLITDVKDGLIELTDALGLTDLKAQELADNEKKRREDSKKNLADFAAGLDTDIELKKRQFIEQSNGNLKLAAEGFKKYVEQTTAENNRIIDSYNQIISSGKKVDDFQTKRTEVAINENKKLASSYSDLEKEITDGEKEAAAERKRTAEARKKATTEELTFAQLVYQLSVEQDAQIEANNKELADRLAAIWQRANELSRAATQEQADEIKAIQDELEIYLDEKGKTAQELELQRLQDTYFEKKTLLENAGQDTTAITEKYEAEQDAIKKKYADEDAARQQELTQKKIQFAGNALNAIAGLADAFAGKDKKNAKRNFQISKAFSIAQAGVNTALAATAALALKPSESLFPGQRFVEMGLAIAAGVAQIAKISSTKFNESGGDSGGGGGSSNFASMASNAMGGGGTVPTFNAMNLSMLQNRPEQTPKAYVLAQDVSSAVEARDKVRDLARIN